MKHLTFTFVLSLFAVAAGAQGFMPWTDVMMMADMNHDGELSMDEVKTYNAKDHFIGFQPFMVDHFKDCDKDDDDAVSMYELKVCTKEMGMTDSETSRVFYKGIGFMPRANQ
jgi:hypothetical protein